MSALRQLHRDERGALAPLILFVLLFFAWGITALLNTGQNTYDKVDAQNAADSIAVAVGEQAARDLNVMVANHMATTQTFTVATVAFTLNEVIVQNQGRLIAATAELFFTCRLYYGCPFVIPPAAADLFSYWSRLQAIDSRYRPAEGLRRANRITNALKRMNDHLVGSFPGRSSRIAALLAERNDIRSVFVYPPCSPSNGSDCGTPLNFPGPSLPVYRSSATRLPSMIEMCWGASYGTDGWARLDFGSHGYDDGKGPYTGGGGAGTPHLRDHVNRQSGMSAFLPSLDRSLRFWRAVAFNFTAPPMFFTQQRPTDNDFTMLMNFYWPMACAGIVPPGASRAFGHGIEMPDNYWLKGRSPLAGLGGSITSGIGALAADYDDYGYLYLVARPKSVRSNAEDFIEPDEPFFAYAQALVYNPWSLDLYTSLWKGDLVPARHMDEPARVAQAMGTTPVSNDFRVMQAIMRGGGAGDWRQVNGH